MPSVWQVPGDTRVLRPSALGLVVDFCNDFKCKCPCHFPLSPSLLIEGCMAYLTLAPHFLSPSLLIEECVACLTWDPQFLSVLYPEAWFLRSDFPRFTCEVRLITVDISHEYSSLIFFFVLRRVLGIEPRILHMPDKCCTTELWSQLYIL